MKFKVGDRVRIDCPISRWHGKEAVIYQIIPVCTWHPAAHKFGAVDGETCYLVDVDGVGTTSSLGGPIGFPTRMLKPSQPRGSWDEITRMVGKDIRDPVQA
jgi:hypothetical protein